MRQTEEEEEEEAVEASWKLSAGKIQGSDDDNTHLRLQHLMETTGEVTSWYLRLAAVFEQQGLDKHPVEKLRQQNQRHCDLKANGITEEDDAKLTMTKTTDLFVLIHEWKEAQIERNKSLEVQLQATSSSASM